MHLHSMALADDETHSMHSTACTTQHIPAQHGSAQHSTALADDEMHSMHSTAQYNSGK